MLLVVNAVKDKMYDIIDGIIQDGRFRIQQII